METRRIAVLGLGYSISEYTPEFDYSIGVNDIWSKVHSDAIVCVNYRKEFTPERLKVIDESKPEIFYSHMKDWQSRPDFKKIELLNCYPESFINLDPVGLYKSYCSPFIACQVAYKFHGATEIHLFGVDLVNHPHLNLQLCGKIKTHFRNLNNALKLKGCQLIVHGNGILTAQL